MKASVETAAGWLDSDGIVVKTVTQANNYRTTWASIVITYSKVYSATV